MHRPIISPLARWFAGGLLPAAILGALTIHTRPVVHAQARSDRFVDVRRTGHHGHIDLPSTGSSPKLAVTNGSNSIVGQTLLNEEGYLKGAYTGDDAARWLRELASASSPERQARLRVQLGEYELGNREPERARLHLDRAVRLVPASNPDRGLASYDLALCMFFEGRFPEARHEFRRVIKSPLWGFNWKNASLYGQHASACASYHAAHGALGIPEPSRLDPLCGASSLAVAMRALGMPHEKAFVVSRVRHTGEGSTMQDLQDALPKLGLAGRIVTADVRGLLASKVPMVAFVERDHFVTVVSADKGGVEYVCSDCGAWPGGSVRLSWKQWRAMDASVFLAIARAGTPQSLALSQLPEKFGAKGVRIALASAGGSDMRAVAAAQRMLTSVAGHMAVLVNPRQHTVACGTRGTSLHCTFQHCAYYVPTCDCHSSLKGEPVNLASGEEEYAPPADLVIYNAHGPSIRWARTFNSLANVTPSGFGSGWSHSYNWRFERLPSGSTYTTELVLPNSGRLLVNVNESDPPTAAQPLKPASFVAGVPMLIEWRYSTTYNVKYYVITFKDRTKWTFDYEAAESFANNPSSYAFFYYPSTIQDASGQSLWLDWLPQSMMYQLDPTTGNGTSLVLDAMGNHTDGTLLQTHYTSSSGAIDNVVDSSPTPSAASPTYRGVAYVVHPYAGTNIPNLPGIPTTLDELTDVSFVKAATYNSSTGLFTVAAIGANGERFRYGYTLRDNGEGTPPSEEQVVYLTSVSVPDASKVSGTAWNGVNRTTSTWAYDAVGAITSVTDGNGNVATFTPNYDGMGNAINTVVTVKKGTATSLSYTVGYNPDLSEASTTYAAGSTQSTVYNEVPSNDPFEPTTVTLGTGTAAWTSHMVWDAYGNMTSHTTPKGTTTTYDYDTTSFPMGELQYVRPYNQTPTEYQYYEPSGLVREIDAPIPGDVNTGATQPTTYTYDAVGNLTTVIVPASSAYTFRTYRYGYTTDGTYTTTERLGEPITFTDPAGKVWHMRYDHSTAYVDSSPSASQLQLRGQLTQQWDPLGNRTDVAYDLANLPTVSYDPATGNTGSGRAAQATSYLYVGGPVSKVDAKDESAAIVRTSTYTYGPEGEQKTQGGADQTATMTYDASYRTLSVADGNAHLTTYGYDTAGRPAYVKYPLATGANFDQVQFTSYDAAGHLLSRTDGNGKVTNYVYADGDGQLSDVQYPASPSENVHVDYDVYGRPYSLTDAVGAATTSYDDLGHATSATRTYTGVPAQTFGYQYWPDGSRKTMTNVAGTWSYDYDVDGRYASLVSPAGTSSAAYLDNGWQISRTLPNGATTTYGYNAVGALSSQLNQTGGGATLSQFSTLAYDGVFNLKSLTATIPGTTLGGSRTNVYDTKDHLTSETGWFGTHASTANAADFPTKVRGTVLTPNSDNQQTAPSTFVYDGNGSPTTYRGTAGYAYDSEARATTMGTVGAGYRADGLRGWKKVGAGAKTYYLYDRGEPVVEIDGSGAVTGVNAFAPDGLVGRYQGGSWTQYAFDPQGSVSHRLSATGATLSTSAYDAYGTETNSGTAPTDTFGFNARSGYILDRETGLYYCQNRYYDPAVGHWLTRDPIGQAGGIDTYAYCVSSPVGYADPRGEMLAALLLLPHGNTVGEQYCEFYMKYSASGEYLKCGISQNAATRYSAREVNGGDVRVVATGTRSEMASLENACVREYAGPENLESFAAKGLRPGQASFFEQLERINGRSAGSGGAMGAIGTCVCGADTLMQGAGVIIPYRKRNSSSLKRVMNGDYDDPPGFYGEDHN